MGLTVTKPAYFHEYPDGSKKIHTGSKIPLGINSPFNQYYGRGLPWLNLIKTASYTLTSPVPGTYSSDGFIDTSTSGSTSFNIARSEERRVGKEC